MKKTTRFFYSLFCVTLLIMYVCSNGFANTSQSNTASESTNSPEDDKWFGGADAIYNQLFIIPKTIDTDTSDSSDLKGIMAIAGTALVAEGISYLFRKIKEEAAKTDASYKAVVISSSEAAIAINNIDYLLFVRSKKLIDPPVYDKDIDKDKNKNKENLVNWINGIKHDKDNTQLLIQSKLKILEKTSYIRVVPENIIFNKSGAKYGSQKDITVTYQLKSPKKDEESSPLSLTFGTTTFENLEEGKDVNSSALSGSDWTYIPSIDTSKRPYSITIDVVETAQGKGAEIAEMISNIASNEDLKKQLTEALVDKWFSEND